MLADASGGNDLGGALATAGGDDEGRHMAGLGVVLDSAAGGTDFTGAGDIADDDTAFGGVFDGVGAVDGLRAGTDSLIAAFTGTLCDSGTSSQPESTASSLGSAGSVLGEPPSAPFAMSFKVPEPLAAWQLRTALSYVAAHAQFSEPRDAFLGT